MARTPVFSRLARTLRIARWCDDLNLPTREGVERALADERRMFLSRRRFLAGLAATGAVAALPRPVRAGRQGALDVGIVGAGLAGLACADRLRARGVVASVFYYFGGVHYPEAAVVDEFRVFTAGMRGDLQLMSRAPTADSFNAIDAELDRMSLAEYLEARGAGALLTAALGEAYVAEYGRELAEQSTLNLLQFIKVDKRSRFLPFGHSDERYHLVGGNDAVAQHLAAGLPQPVQHGLLLVGLRKLGDGRIEIGRASE